MTNEVVTKEKTFINNPQLLDSKIIREYFDPQGKATKEELAFFLALAHEKNLNPFLKEIYFVKYNGSPAQTIVSKEVFMKTAESHPSYQGFEAGVVTETPDGELVERKGSIIPSKDKLVGGWCRVHRSDRKIPIEVQVSLSEFGKGQSTWKTMPANMIRKSAIVNGLREAFPGTLNGLYTEEDAGKIPERRDVTPEQSQNDLSDLISVPTEQDKMTQEILENEMSEVQAVDQETGEITDEQTALFDQLGDLM